MPCSINGIGASGVIASNMTNAVPPAVSAAVNAPGRPMLGHDAVGDDQDLPVAKAGEHLPQPPTRSGAHQQRRLRNRQQPGHHPGRAHRRRQSDGAHHVTHEIRYHDRFPCSEFAFRRVHFDLNRAAGQHFLPATSRLNCSRQQATESAHREAAGSVRRRSVAMKKVVGISLGASDQDFEFSARFLRQRFNVRRLGTDGSTAKAVKLLKHWEQHADAIGLGVVKDSYTVGARRYIEKDSTRMKERRDAHSRDHRRAPLRHPAGMGGAPRPDQARQLLQQRQRAVLLGDDQLQAGHGDVRVHAEPAVRRPAAAARRAQAPDLARRAGALHQRRALRARTGRRPR